MPTRDGIGRQSLLDITATSEPHPVQDVSITAPLGKSDHFVMDMTFDHNWCRVQSTPEREVWLFHLAKKDGLRNALHSIHWTTALDNERCDDAWSHWREALLTISSKFINRQPSKLRQHLNRG